MKLIDKRIKCPTRTTAFSLYVLGDLHVGALNCAEKEIKALVTKIKSNPNAYWIGGGDYCDAVVLTDVKRFDVNTIPNWMLQGDPTTIKERIGDILFAQRKRFYHLVEPIKDRCLGLIEGNHEYTVFKYHNHDHLMQLCDLVDAPNLTDCAFIRLRFDREPAIRTVIVFINHGHGGGVTPGGEATRLARLASDKDADIILTGHSHTYHIMPPIPVLAIPRKGHLPDDLLVRYKYVANWGSCLYTYKQGPSTYSSRASYPVRPMYTVETIIEPHQQLYGQHNDCYEGSIKMQGLRLI